MFRKYSILNSKCTALSVYLSKTEVNQRYQTKFVLHMALLQPQILTPARETATQELRKLN